MRSEYIIMSDFAIAYLTYPNAPSQYHCYSLGRGFNWRWSTPILMSTFFKLENGSYGFTTRSGTQYSVKHYKEMNFSEQRKQFLCDWYGASSMEVLTQAQFEQIISASFLTRQSEEWGLYR